MYFILNNKNLVFLVYFQTSNMLPEVEQQREQENSKKI